MVYLITLCTTIQLQKKDIRNNKNLLLILIFITLLLNYLSIFSNIMIKFIDIFIQNC